MGILKCACKAEAEGRTFEDADVKIDHGIALSLSGPACSGHPARMTWDKHGHYNKTGKLVVDNPKRVACQNVMMLVGDEANYEDELVITLKKELSKVTSKLELTEKKLGQTEKDLEKPKK